MKKYLALLIVLAIASTAAAQKLTPTQKSTPQNSPVQKTYAPDQVAVPQSTPVQKPMAPMGTPTQKTIPYGSPVQKGYGTSGVMLNVPEDIVILMARSQMLEREPCQPVRNLVRCIAKKVIRRRIGDIIEDLPRPPLPGGPGGMTYYSPAPRCYRGGCY